MELIIIIAIEEFNFLETNLPLSIFQTSQSVHIPVRKLVIEATTYENHHFIVHYQREIVMSFSLIFIDIFIS